MEANIKFHFKKREDLEDEDSLLLGRLISASSTSLKGFLFLQTQTFEEQEWGRNRTCFCHLAEPTL